MTTRETLAEKMTEPENPEEVSGSEIGVPGQYPFSGDRELINVREIDLARLEEMRNVDGQARALLRVLTLPLRRARMVVTPQEESEDSEDGSPEAEFVETVLTKPYHQGGMKYSMVQTIAFLGLALVDGFAVFEKVWRLVDGQVLLKKLAPRAAETCTFILDRNGGLEYVRQRVTWQGESKDVKIPAEKLLVWTCQHEENPWYGRGVMLPAYYHYDKKHRIYYAMHLAAQFYAVPGRLGKVPANWTEAEKMKFHSKISNLGMQAAITIEEGTEVEEFGGKGGMPDYIPMVDHHDSMMAKSILAQFLQLGTGTDTGSWALSTDQTDLFLVTLESILDEWANIFNMYVIPQLVDWNFGTGAYPTISFEPLNDRERVVIREMFQAVFSGQGVSNLTPDFLFNLEREAAEALGLEVDYDQLEEQLRTRQEMQMESEKAAIAEFKERQRNPGGVQDGGAGGSRSGSSSGGSSGRSGSSGGRSSS